MKNTGKIILYKAKDGQLAVDVKLENETVWLTQKQMAKLFDIDRSVITKHIRNIFKNKEVKEKSNVQKMHIANSDKPVKFYNLDIILAVGYRVNTSVGIQFRIWATQVLKDHILKGFTINQKRLQERGLTELEETFNLIKDTISSRNLTTDENTGLLEVITTYTNSWILLQKYDKNKLKKPRKKQKPKYKLTYNDSLFAISQLKQDLDTTPIFGRQKDKSFQGIIGNIYQTFNKKELYKSLEEKAAHLLYFIIKDHPFTDGNKRIGILLFILFLTKNHHFSHKEFSNTALVALALLIAESHPQQKETIILLTMNFISHT